MVDFSWCSTRVATGAALTSVDDFFQLAGVGITAVVDTRAEWNAGPFAKGVEMEYLWAPTVDDGQPKPVEYWEPILTFALTLLSKPYQRVSCHCGSGVNRGPSAALCILVAQGWSPEGAEAQMRAARPQVGLAYKADAIAACVALGYA